MVLVTIILEYSLGKSHHVKGELVLMSGYGKYQVYFGQFYLSKRTGRKIEQMRLKSAWYRLTEDRKLKARFLDFDDTRWHSLNFAGEHEITWTIDCIHQVLSAYLTWLVIARRLGIPKDISRGLIAPYLFASRYHDDLWVPVMLKKNVGL